MDEEKMSVGQFDGNKPRLLAVDIEHMLERRIRDGIFPEGTQIPTVRELAEELGVNKNTIVRAYKALARKGYLVLIRGRGAFVQQREPALGHIDSRWLSQLDQLLNDARRFAVNKELLVEEILDRINHVYGQDNLRIAFVECNAEDVETLGEELRAAVKHSLEGVLLANVLANPQEFAAQYDLVVTTFYHLSEVGQALGEDRRKDLIGVHAMPTHDTLLKIARLQAQVIGLVCETGSAADTLGHIIQAYHGSATVIPVKFEDQARVQSLLTKADAIIVTRSCHQRLMQFQPTVPVISVAFTIEQQSVDFLRRRIAALTGTEARNIPEGLAI